MNRIFSLFIMLGICLSAFADDAQKYRQFADTVRAEVWGMELPAFNVKAAPPEYAGESAVVLAAYRGINAKKKTGIAFNVAMLSNILTSPIKTTPQIHATDIYRRLIQINDKAALEKFSEFELTTRENTGNYLNFWAYYKEDVKYVLGVRVIKPDGRTVEIETDEFVNVKEGKKEKETKQKLAVPGLEIGDKIDVFYYSQSKLKNAHLDPIEIYFRDEYPILDYQVHLELDDKLTSQIRTMNGAPEFTYSQNQEKDYVVDAHMTDIAPRTPRLWYNRKRQSPYAFIAIYNRRNKQEPTPESAKKDGIQVNPDPLKIQDDAWKQQENVMYNNSFFATLTGHLNGGKKVAGNLKKMLKKGEITPQQAADYLYNLLVLSYSTNGYRYYRGDFVYYYRMFLKMIGIDDAEMIIMSTDKWQPLDQAIQRDNIHWGVHIKSLDRYYFPVSGLTAPGEIPAAYQENQAARRAPKKKKDYDGSPLQFNLPTSTPDDNRSISAITADIDGTQLNISRRELNSGTRKNVMIHLLTDENLVDGYLRYLNRYGQSIALKENKKKTAERQERYSDGRQEQLAAIKEEIKDYHETEPAQFKNYRIDNIGIDPDSAWLDYTIDYTMDGLVKRAGRNLLVSVGRLMSPQTEVFPSDRVRTDDIHMDSPRLFETVINLRIPDGYRVSQKSLASLTQNVENVAGSFSSTADINGSTLVIRTIKKYNHKIEPATNWTELTKVLDAAANWRTSTILIEKQ